MIWTLLCRVWRMMSASSIPRFLASVTNPARSECAEYPDKQGHLPRVSPSQQPQ